MNLADTRQRGTESVTPSSRASAESGANNIIMDRDGTLCVFALSSPAEKAHLIPHRVQSKVSAFVDVWWWLLTNRQGRWAALAAKRFPGVDDINAPENIITLDRGLHSLVDQHKYAFLPVCTCQLCLHILDSPSHHLQLDEHLTEDDVHPQGSNGPPAKANRTKCKTILLHEVLALPPPKPRSSRDQLAHDEQLESHRTRFPHNLRPQFMTLDRLPSLAILGYRYALVIVDHYGTAGTKKLLDQDYTVDPDPDHSPDLDDGDHEAHTPTDGGSPGKGFHLRLPSNFQQGGRKSSRNATNAPKDEGAVADMWDVALDREDNLRVAPCQADVDALLAKRDEEKLQSVREWVLTQRLSY